MLFKVPLHSCFVYVKGRQTYQVHTNGSYSFQQKNTAPYSPEPPVLQSRLFCVTYLLHHVAYFLKV